MTDTFRSITIPHRMNALPRTPSGMPVPRFASWKDGKPDFAVMDTKFIYQAIGSGLCAICGQPLGRHKAFVGGPKSVGSMAFAEAPFHRDCAEFGLQVCPYVLTGHDHQSNKPTDEYIVNNMVDPKNPKIFALVIATKFSFIQSHKTFLITEQDSVHWWKHGKPATPEEIAIANQIVEQTRKLLRQ